MISTAMFQLSTIELVLTLTTFLPVIEGSFKDLLHGSPEHGDHGEVLVKSMSAKVQGILPHGYDPIHKSTSFILDSKFLHPIILGKFS